jgi:phage shock protein A
MGIFQKLSLLIRSNINDAIAKAENPEKVLNQLITDMREQLARAKQEVAVAIADERKLKAQVEEERKQGADWEHRAVLAVREGRDDLAKQALVRQQEHADRANTLEETWRKQAEETEKVKASLRQLNDKIEEAKRKKNLLVAKQKRAQAQKRIHQTMTGLNDRSAFEAFERVAERIEESERQLLAADEVTQALTGDSLETEFRQLESGDTGTGGVEARLEALKEQLGLPSGGKTTAALPAGEEEEEAEGEKVEADVEILEDDADEEEQA